MCNVFHLALDIRPDWGGGGGAVGGGGSGGGGGLDDEQDLDVAFRSIDTFQ